MQKVFWTLGLHLTRCVRFNLLVGRDAGRFFVTGYFPPILWFHLLLIQFLGQDEGKGRWAPTPDVSWLCFFFFFFLQTGVITLGLKRETTVHEITRADVCAACGDWSDWAYVGTNLDLMHVFLIKLYQRKKRLLSECLLDWYQGPLFRNDIITLIALRSFLLLKWGLSHCVEIAS